MYKSTYSPSQNTISCRLHFWLEFEAVEVYELIMSINCSLLAQIHTPPPSKKIQVQTFDCIYTSGPLKIAAESL